MIYERIVFLAGRKVRTILIGVLVLLNILMVYSAEIGGDLLSSFSFGTLLLTIILLIANLVISKSDIIYRSCVSAFLLLYCSSMGYLMWDFLTHVD